MTETASQTNQEIVYIPFNKLTVSPINVRVVSPSDKADKELLASLRANGILQNLIVHSGKRGKFAVSAGGRRFAGLSVLHGKKEIPSDFLVPCKVAKDEAQAVEWSLAENSGREDMHPADQFQAFAALEKNGKTRKQIAIDFGVSQKYVTQVMALASVAPELIAVFRAGKLELEHMEAFAVSNDHKKQVDTFKSLKGWQLNPNNIRSTLVGEAVTSDNRLVKFIGMKAYKKAGGAFSTDLFQDCSYLADTDLVTALAQEALVEPVAALVAEGWKWVDADLVTRYADSSAFATRLEAGYADTLDANTLVDALKVLENELEALHDLDADDWTDECEAREEALDEEIDALEDQLAEHKAFTDAQREMAGVVVYINNDGKLEAVRGFVKSEDMKAAKVSQDEEADTQMPEEKPLESAALQQDLRGYVTQAMQAELLKHAGLCNDLLVFTLAEQHLNGEHWSHAVNVKISAVSLSPEDLDTTTAASALSDARNALDVSWMVVETQAERLALFTALPVKKKQQIMAYCVASSFQCGATLGAAINETTGFNLLSYWKPTAENYFRRIKMSDLLDIGRGAIGAEWAEQNAKAKKGDLVNALNNAPELAAWLPESLT